MNRVKYALPVVAPKVSIVICTRDRADLLASCVDSIIDRSTYRNYEVVIVDNGSTEEATFRLVRPASIRAISDTARRVGFQLFGVEQSRGAGSGRRIHLPAQQRHRNP